MYCHQYRFQLGYLFIRLEGTVGIAGHHSAQVHFYDVPHCPMTIVYILKRAGISGPHRTICTATHQESQYEYKKYFFSQHSVPHFL